MNLEWKQVDENHYQILLDNDLLGFMFRDSNLLWNLDIARWNIHEKNPFRETLIELAEAEIKKALHIKDIPVAFCNICDEYSTGKPCNGVFNSAICNKDWIVCPTCNGSGNSQEKKCEQCDGLGWVLNRKL